MNVLVTGSTGFVGKSIINSLKKGGFNVYATSRSHDYQLDITDSNNLKQICNEKFIDVIVHTAAKAIVSNCELDPFNTFKTNTLGVASVLEAARLSSVKKVIIFETDKVYGVQEVLPTDETQKLNPNSPYELSKAMGSELCEFYRTYYGLDIISLRPVNIFGSNDKCYNRIIPATMMAIINQKDVPLYNDALKMERDFIHIDDVSRIVEMLILNKTQHNVYNLSAGYIWNIEKLVNHILKITDTTTSKVNVIQKKHKFTEIPVQHIDGRRLIEEFNFQYSNFNESILKTIEGYKRHIERRD